LHGLLSCALLPCCLRGGEMLKKGFRGVALRQCLNKTVPLIHPVVAATATTLFLPMHTDDREVTHLTPAERTSQGLPKLRIKKRFFRGHEERGLVIFSRPRGIVVRGSFIVGVHPVRTVYVITSFGGFGQGFLDRHRCSPSHLLLIREGRYLIVRPTSNM